MENKNKLWILRILVYSGAFILLASIILTIVTENKIFYIGIVTGVFLMIFSIITSLLRVKKQTDERYKAIREKASHITLMILFIAGPIIVCCMLFTGEFFTIESLVKASNILTFPLIILTIVYYIAVFYFKKQLGE